MRGGMSGVARAIGTTVAHIEVRCCEVTLSCLLCLIFTDLEPRRGGGIERC